MAVGNKMGSGWGRLVSFREESVSDVVTLSLVSLVLFSVSPRLELNSFL